MMQMPSTGNKKIKTEREGRAVNDATGARQRPGTPRNTEAAQHLSGEEEGNACQVGEGQEQGQRSVMGGDGL